MILLLSLPHPHLFMLAVSGFFLIAPLLAAGLYEISRRHQRGEPVSFFRSQSFWRRNGGALAMFGLLLAIVGLAWERLTAVLFALFIGPEAESIGQIVLMILHDSAYRGFALSWFLVGALLAALVFVLSALSVPMMLDRPVDMATASMTSIRGVTHNLPAMLLWAALIVAITLLGFATFLFGLIVVALAGRQTQWQQWAQRRGLERQPRITQPFPTLRQAVRPYREEHPPRSPPAPRRAPAFSIPAPAGSRSESPRPGRGRGAAAGACARDRAAAGR